MFQSRHADQCTSPSLTLNGEAIETANGILDLSERVNDCCDGLYVHVPFCVHRCHYCDFFTIAGREESRGKYVDRLLGEARAGLTRLEGAFETVFIGGGTPTLLDPGDLARLLGGLAGMLKPDVSREWTVEANPETVTETIARTLVAHGVNRVSVGAQSFNVNLLAALERQHDPANVGRSVERLRRAGIESISLDLIFGIPGQDLGQWRADLDEALALEPDHLSCYGLVYEPGTPLRRRLESGRVQRVDQDTEAAMYEHLRDRLAQAGFEQYEISNWARPGHRCRHNLHYWRNGTWWPLGPSASGHLAGVRWRNVPRLGQWLEGTGLPGIDRVERLGRDDRLGEALMLGLRCTDGVEQEVVRAACATPGRGPLRQAAIERYEADGLLCQGGNRLALTLRGQLLADLVIRDLL